MLLLRRAVLPAALLAVVASSLAAQQLQSPAAADSARASNTRMRSDLRNLVTAQEARYAQAASYARTDVEKKSAPEGEPICDGDGLTERAAFAREAQSAAGGALMRVAKSEERHFGRTGAYTADLAALTGLRFAGTVTVTVELADAPNGEAAFLATATDSRYPGYSCVLASGWARFRSPATTLAEKKHAGGGSIPVCDDFR